MTTQQAIIMSNNFAQYAPYKAPTIAHHLMWLYLSKLDAFAEDPDPVIISVTEINDFLFAMSQANGRSTTERAWGGGKKRVESAVIALKQVVAGILNPETYPAGGGADTDARKHELYRSFYSVFDDIVTCRNKKGDVCYKFDPNPKLKRYIFHVIGQNYTKFMLFEDTQVSQKHACRLYPALKSRFSSQRGKAPLPFYETTVDALRRLLQLADDEYPAIYDFWRYVVVAAIDDINANSTLRVDAQQIKVGRTLKKIRFYVTESEHSRQQLKLSVSTVGDKKLQVLKRIAEAKVWVIDIEEFASWFPKELASIRRLAKDRLDSYIQEAVDAGQHTLSEEVYNSQLEAGIRNGMRQYARDELVAAT